jgi:molecular chaperone GrpE
MSGGRDRRPTVEPVDGVYEIDLEGDSAEDALREAVEAVEAASPSPAAAGGESGAAGEGETPEQTELEKLREKYVRVLADYDNYRKRAERERGETSRTAMAEPLRAFLGVVDNLDRALRAGGSLDDLKSGVEMIQRQTGDLLRRFGVEEVESVGQPFDPAVHEAVIRYEDPSVREQTVSEEFQKGYRYQGRLLRPAMVKVAVPREGGGPANDGGDDTEQ